MLNTGATSPAEAPPEARRPPAGSRSVLLAWMLMPFGGCLGLHHLYVGRYVQAGLWACSCGGFFFGLWRDLLRIPSYVEASNDSERAQEELEVQMKYSKQPPWAVTRMIGCYYFGVWFAICGSVWGPEGFPLLWFRLMKALLGGVGVWLAGYACTHQSGSFKLTLLGSFVGEALDGYASLCALGAFQWTRQWQPEATKPRPALWKVLLLVWFFWTATFYGTFEHGSISTTVGGEERTYKINESFFNILRGLSLEDFQSSFGEGGSKVEWDFSDYNWENFFQRVSSNLDVAGERRALKTLEMASFIGKRYTASDVKKHYREMAKRWHPDHVAQVDKGKAEAMMQEINEAKEVLDKILR